MTTMTTMTGQGRLGVALLLSLRACLPFSIRPKRTSSIGSALSRVVFSTSDGPDLDAGGPGPAQAALPRVHASTVAMVPPDETWTPIQRARREVGDAGLLRWPPHCNLIYPFVPPKVWTRRPGVPGVPGGGGLLAGKSLAANES